MAKLPALPTNRLHIHVVPIAIVSVLLTAIAIADISLAVNDLSAWLDQTSQAATGSLFKVNPARHGLATFSFDKTAVPQSEAGIPGFDTLGDTSRHSFLIQSAAAETAAAQTQAEANQQLLGSKAGHAFRTSFRN